MKNDTYKTILRSIERMLNAVNNNIVNGKFVGTVQSLELIKDFIDDIKDKSPIDKRLEIDGVVRAQVNYIRSRGNYIPDFLMNKLDSLI